MNIVYTTNEAFVAKVAASICSVVENNKEADDIRIFVMGQGLSEKSCKRLNKLVSRYGRALEIIPLENVWSFFDFDFDTGGWNPIILARLVLDRLLPADVDRVVYLDGDTINIRNLTKLWNTDMKGKAIGACIEATVDRQRLISLGMEDIPYVNSGVLLIDLEQWREENWGHRIIKYYEEQGGKLFAPDQDAINGALKGEIFYLEPQYNFYNIYWFYPYKVLKNLMRNSFFYSEAVVKRACEKPVVIHYLGEERPWRKGNHHKYRAYYEKYLKKTPWRDEKQEEGWEIYYFFWDIFNILTRLFPTVRYQIINRLIPLVMKWRKRQLSRNESTRTLPAGVHTFAICAYKESPYLEECILSLENQTVKSKIIMVTSTPNQYIEDLAGKHNIPLYVNEGEKGITQDWNYAYSMAKSKFVTIAHQDDVYLSDYTQGILNLVKKSKKPLIAFTDYGELRGEKVVLNNTIMFIKRIMLLPLRVSVLQKSRFVRRRILSFGDPICCPAVTFAKKNLPEQIFKNGFRSDEDWEAWEMISKRKGDFLYTGKTGMLHRIHCDSETSLILKDDARSKEDYVMFSKFWPRSVACFLAKWYSKSENSNEL